LSDPSDPTGVPGTPEDKLREAVVTADEQRRQEQARRRAELQLQMMRSIVTEPLLSKLSAADAGTKFDVIISLNEFFVDGIDGALDQVKKRADSWNVKYTTTSHYCFAYLTKDQILSLAQEAHDLIQAYGQRATVIYRMWQDDDVNVSLTKSCVTIKADAAQRAYEALGQDIVWAVMDSGVHGAHPHFRSFDNLNIGKPLEHSDFTPLNNGALEDEFGHGSHVAGIIAGSWQSTVPEGEPVVGAELRNEQGSQPLQQREMLKAISGVAPRCKLLSMKVIADKTFSDPGTGSKQVAGQGKVSWILLAIDQIQKWNQNGKRLLVHGVNMSLGYDFDPRWFACGQSPLCVEVNRLVKAGVVVVVSAGNSGYSAFLNAAGAAESRYSDLSITDPGNAELAITVGSTHREMPHMYGVSYFSSRGPTGDGRLKPDLVAPGERIISCAAGLEAAKYAHATLATAVTAPAGNPPVNAAPVQATGSGAAAATPDNSSAVPVLYCEQTGTSMAAPHVSGAVAAFLSVRREFIGEPEQVKDIFMSNTVDLHRQREFQGAGLINLMKVLQAV